MDELVRILGLSEQPQQLGYLQVALRSILIYGAALLLVRFSRNRFLGRNTPFDLIVGFVFGSLLSRSINGAAPVFPTIVAAAVIIGMDWLLSFASIRSSRLDLLLNGTPTPIVVDGRLDDRGVRKALLSDRSINEALRTAAGTEAPSGLRSMMLERSGRFGAVPAERQRTIDVEVEEGVQVVRIELEG